MDRFSRAIVAFVLLGLFAPHTPAEVAKALPGGGYCVFLRNGQEPVEGTDYLYNGTTGKMLLYKGGFWDIRYQTNQTWLSPGPWKDVHELKTQSGHGGGGGFSVLLVGRNVAADVNLNYCDSSGPRTFHFVLHDGGSINDGVLVEASTCTLHDSEIPGDLAGTLHVKKIADGADGTELKISGDLSGYLEVDEMVGSPSANSIVKVHGDVTGSIWVHGVLYGTIDIVQDVVNSAENFVRIKQMIDGTFKCNDLAIGVSDGFGLYIGHNAPLDVPFTQSGTVEVSGTLSGWLSLRGESDLHIDIGAINAPGRGIQNWIGCLPGSIIEVGTFTAGMIGYIADVPSTVIPLDGAITVEGYMGTNAEIVTPAGQYNRDIDAAITVWGAMNGTIDCGGDLNGSIDSTDNINGDINGDIIIRGDCAGYIHGADDLDGEIQILGSLDDVGGIDYEIDIDGSIGGDISVAGAMNGTVDCAGDFDGSIDSTGNINGDISIHGDCAGSIHSDGNLNGEIQIDGSLDDVAGIAYEVDIEGSMAADAAVTVIYPGWELEQDNDWEDGAIVRVDSQNYGGNTPSAHVWEITCLKGDLNNSGTFNLFDIDPFVLALADPPEYAAQFPGLSGSRLYHADMNCDEVVSNFDIEAFVLLLTDPDQYYVDYPDCEKCPARGRGGAGLEYTALQWAAVLEEYVAAERMSFAADAAKQLAAELKDASRAKFWSDVYDALVE